MPEIFNGNSQEAEIIISALKAIPPICALLKIAAEAIFKKNPTDDGGKNAAQEKPEKPAPKRHSGKKVGGSLDHE